MYFEKLWFEVAPQVRHQEETPARDDIFAGGIGQDAVNGLADVPSFHSLELFWVAKAFSCRLDRFDSVGTRIRAVHKVDPCCKGFKHLQAAQGVSVSS